MIWLLIVLAATQAVRGQRKDASVKSDTLKSGILSGLKWRGIGPAFASGRIADFAVNPNNPFEYYVAVAAGNVWKTNNAGITYEPIFDNYGSWSIADVEIDPTKSQCSLGRYR